MVGGECVGLVEGFEDLGAHFGGKWRASGRADSIAAVC